MDIRFPPVSKRHTTDKRARFSFNLKGNEEWLFKQGWYTPEHIITDIGEYLERFYTVQQDFRELVIRTYCNRSLRFSPNYSRIRKHSGILRNACEFCFTEYEPERGGYGERKQEEQRRRDDEGLPF